MLNGVFVALVLGSVLLAAYGGGMEAVTKALLDSARGAVDLAIGLVGVMALFLGLMKVAEDGGLLRMLSRALWPVLRRLFPSVPRDHPALHAILLNLSSNFLGLGKTVEMIYSEGFAVRDQGDDRAGPPQRREGYRHRRHGAVPGDQHLRAGIAAERGDRHPGRARIRERGRDHGADVDRDRERHRRGHHDGVAAVEAAVGPEDRAAGRRRRRGARRRRESRRPRSGAGAKTGQSASHPSGRPRWCCSAGPAG